MAPARSSRPRRPSKEHSIPVKVVSRHAPRVSATEAESHEPAVVAPVIPPEPKKTAPATPRIPTTDADRRRMMRWVVGVGAIVIVTGWLVTVRYEVAGTTHQSNILSDIVRSFRNLKFGGSKTASPKQQEIQQYQQEVFPQFTNQ